MTDIDALAIELHKHLFVTVTDWRDEAGDWDSLGEQAKSEYRLVARRVRDMVAGPTMTNPGDTVEGLVERLRRKARHEKYVNGKVVGRSFAINPDGPAAADTILALRTQCEVMAKALEAFARCPTHGKNGGPFVIANACYEDMTKGSAAPRQAYWHRDDFERARAALQSYRTIRAEIK